MWWAPLLIWTSQESHLEPFQSSYRSQDQLFKQLSVIIKCMASERKLVRVVKSRKPPKGKSAMNKKLLEDRCQCPQSGVFHIIMSWEAALLEWSSWSRRRTLKLHRILLLITWTKKKPSGGKLCGHLKQTELFDLIEHQYVWRTDGEASTPRTPHPLSSLVLGVWWCGAVLLSVDLLL